MIGDTPSISGEWTAIEIDGEPILETVHPQVEFAEDGRVSGCATINRIAGSYTMAGDVLQLSPLATTMMAGPPELMAQEACFLETMSGDLRVSVMADGSVLLSSAGHSVRLVRRAGAGASA
jgi:heat shock protein HslJ